MNPCAVALSTFTGVGGCGLPNELKMNLIGTLVCAVWKSPPILASAADTTIFLIVLHSVSIGPFNFGEQVFLFHD